MANESITIYKLIILYFLKKTQHSSAPDCHFRLYCQSWLYQLFHIAECSGRVVKCRFYRRRRNIPFILLYADRSRAAKHWLSSAASFPLKSVLRLMLIWLNIRLRSSMRLLLSVITTRQTTELIWLPAV